MLANCYNSRLVITAKCWKTKMAVVTRVDGIFSVLFKPKMHSWSNGHHNNWICKNIQDKKVGNVGVTKSSASVVLTS
jgi:hypothetical protein